MTNKKRLFQRGPLLWHQQNKGRGQNVKMVLSSFKDTKVKLRHSKPVPPSKISLSYPQCFNVSSVNPLVRALFPTNPIPEVPLAGRIKFFYSNWVKLMQDLNILNIVHRFEIPFLENPEKGNHPILQFWIRKNPSLSRTNSRKFC